MDELALLKRNIFNMMTLAIIGLAAFIAILLEIVAPHYQILIMGAIGYCIFSTPLYFLSIKNVKLELMAHIYLGIWIFFTSLMSVYSGGIEGPMTFIYTPIPLIALIFLKPRETAAWTIFAVCVLGVITGYSDELVISSKWMHLLFSIASLIAILIVGYVHYTFTEKYRQQAEDKVEIIKKTHAQLIQSAKLASLGEMSAGVAHEINNPLTIINMRINQIQRYSKLKTLSEQDFDKFFSDIYTSSTRIIRIINGLRLFAKDTHEDPFIEASFHSIVEKVMELAHQRLKHGGIKLSIVASSESIAFECRQVQIAQVLINLINNSFDAIKDLHEKWVRIEANETINEVIIRVVDSGRGIPIEIADKMMQPFFSTKPIGQGTGLGLSVSLGIVENHHGTLQVDHNSPNTCITMIFPKKQTTEERISDEKKYSFSS